MFFVRYKFRHIEYNTIHTPFKFITRMCLTLVDDTKNGAVANFYNTNFSGASSVV